MTFDLKDMREWISFILLVIGGSIALRTFILNQRQRKLENSFRLIELFNRSLRDDDLSNWHKIFITSSELAGAKYGHFLDEKKNQRPFADLFSEGNYHDQGAIERICELFNLVGYEYLRGTIDLRVIYFEFGQLLHTVHDWVSSIETGGQTSVFLSSRYPYFHQMFQKNIKVFPKLPFRTISHIE